MQEISSFSYNPSFEIKGICDFLNYTFIKV